MRYHMKVAALKRPVLNRLWQRMQMLRGADAGSYDRLPQYIRAHAPGTSFADVGCMWGVNGAYAFLAEEVGATCVKAIDVFGPTPEFEAERQARHSTVEFILGDVTQPETIARAGVVDVVFCAGVLYHHPSPFDLLVALRRICGRTLILRSSTIPEVPGLPNVAVYYPGLRARDRRLWQLQRLGVGEQVGITRAFRAADGYGNWFWGLTPSCVASMLATAGFRVERQASEAFAQTFLCRTVEQPFAHRLPGDAAGRAIGQAVSASGRARPS